MFSIFCKTQFIVIAFFMATTYADDWNQWRGPNRNGKSKEIGLPSNWTPGQGGSENVIWRQTTDIMRETETSSSAQDAGSLVVVGTGVNGRIFFMHSMEGLVSSRTICLRESDGAFLWDYVTLVYGGDGFQACLNHQGAATPYVDVINQRVYTGTKEGRLLCFDFQGNVIWRRLTQLETGNEDPNAFGVMIHNCGNSTPLLEGNMVIFPLCAGDRNGVPANVPKLVALDRNDGSTIWTQNFDPYAGPRFEIIHGSWSAPVIATTPDGVRRVFYQFGDGSIRCVRASDGVLLWTQEDDSGMRSAHGGTGQEGVSAPVYNPPGPFEIATGAVYASAGIDPTGGSRMGDGRVWKIDAQTGEQIWHYPSGQTNDLGNVIAAVAISDNRLYIGDTSGYLHCVDITSGTRIWRQLLGGGEIWASASIADGKIYIGTQDGDFYIIEDSPNFNVLDVDNVGSPIASSVAVANNAIYVKSSQFIWKVQVDSPVPVELSSFTASVDKDNVHLNWLTATEMNNFGFDIERRTNGKDDWTKIAFVSGNGTSVVPVHYEYYDLDLQPGSYEYRLKQIDLDGSFEYSGIVSTVVGLPETFTLHQNFPNPFNPATAIHYQIPFRKHDPGADNRTILRIYNLLGEEVRTLVAADQAPGFYKVIWDGKDNLGRRVTSGVYYYQLKSGNIIDTKKMVLVE